MDYTPEEKGGEIRRNKERGARISPEGGKLVKTSITKSLDKVNGRCIITACCLNDQELAHESKPLKTEEEFFRTRVYLLMGLSQERRKLMGNCPSKPLDKTK